MSTTHLLTTEQPPVMVHVGSIPTPARAIARKPGPKVAESIVRNRATLDFLKGDNMEQLQLEIEVKPVSHAADIAYMRELLKGENNG